MRALMPSAPPEAWSARVLRVERMRQALALSLLAAVAASAAFLLTPSRFTPAIPGDEALGTPFSGTLKANRDYDVRDPVTTAEKREEAARSVLPAYDFDDGAAEILKNRIADAFGRAREALQQWRRENPQRAVRLRPDARLDVETYRFLISQREELWKALQAVLEDDDYLELARGQFDPAVERAAQRLADVAASGFIVEDRGLLAADRERGGITVRPLSGSRAEQAVRDVDRIQDLSEARAAVEKLAAAHLTELRPDLANAVAALVRRALRPNLAYDDAETRRRQDIQRSQVKDVLLRVRKGERIIGDGEQITKTHLLIFQALRAAGRSGEAEQARWGGGIFAALICAAVFGFGRRSVRKFRLRSRDVVLLAGLLVGQLFLVKGALVGAESVHDALREAVPGTLGAHAAEAISAAVPWALGSMLVRFLLNSEAALLWTAAYAPLCGLLAGGSLQASVLALVGGVVAADRIGHAGRRSAVFRAGLSTGVATAVVLAAFALFEARFWSWGTAAAMAGAIASGALLLPVLVLLVSPVLELVFGYVTDVELLKLANFNHSVLKDLIVQAPGTYHHAILIGQLVDAAAREIGANPLLARVGAYYHDIGKGKNPLYFGENQKGENRHDALEPEVSAQLIRRHVTEGAELAKHAHLPRQITDFILQHHGTRVIGFFYHRAREEAERSGAAPPDESGFRYPGPKPQIREIALVMIADMVVATARNLPSTAPDKLRAVVERAIHAVVSEGQLDECEITLRDLEKTEESFIRSLEAIFGRADPAAVPRLRVLEADLKRA